MIEVKRNTRSDSKYLNMSKRELIEEIVSYQIKEIRLQDQIKALHKDIATIEAELVEMKNYSEESKTSKTSKQKKKLISKEEISNE